MDYQEKILELAIKEGLQVLKGEKLENIYNQLFLKLIKENEDLKYIINKNTIMIEDLENMVRRVETDKYNLNIRKENLEDKNKDLEDNNESINKKFLYLKDNLLKTLADEYDKAKEEN